MQNLSVLRLKAVFSLGREPFLFFLGDALISSREIFSLNPIAIIRGCIKQQFLTLEFAFMRILTMAVLPIGKS